MAMALSWKVGLNFVTEILEHVLRNPDYSGIIMNLKTGMAGNCRRLFEFGMHGINESEITPCGKKGRANPNPLTTWNYGGAGEDFPSVGSGASAHVMVNPGSACFDPPTGERSNGKSDDVHLYKIALIGRNRKPVEEQFMRKLSQFGSGDH